MPPFINDRSLAALIQIVAPTSQPLRAPYRSARMSIGAAASHTAATSIIAAPHAVPPRIPRQPALAARS